MLLIYSLALLTPLLPSPSVMLSFLSLFSYLHSLWLIPSSFSCFPSFTFSQTAFPHTLFSCSLPLISFIEYHWFRYVALGDTWPFCGLEILLSHFLWYCWAWNWWENITEIFFCPEQDLVHINYVRGMTDVRIPNSLYLPKAFPLLVPILDPSHGHWVVLTAKQKVTVETCSCPQCCKLSLLHIFLTVLKQGFSKFVIVSLT